VSSKRKERKAERDTQSRTLRLEAKNDRQRQYITAIKTTTVTFGVGPAGTGKTYIAAALAADMLKCAQIKSLILCRPAVEAGEKLGFLPGEIGDKMAPWVAPFMDVLKERLGSGTLDKLMKSGAIEIAPFSFMRGRTFKDAFILLDEAQNTTREQMKLFLTRIGENAKVVVNGDTKQSDIGKNSGLTVALELAEQHNIPCSIVKFERGDIVRSAVCQAWVEAFEGV